MRKSQQTFLELIEGLAGGSSIIASARRLDITEQTVHRWIKESKLSLPGYIIEYRGELVPFHVAVASARRRAEPPPDDWLDLPGDHPPTMLRGTPEKPSPIRLSPLPGGQQDLSRGVIERADIAELRRLVALPPKNPRPKAAQPLSVFIGKPEHEDIPQAARAAPPPPERVIAQPGPYVSMADRSEGIGPGIVHPGGYKVS